MSFCILNKVLSPVRIVRFAVALKNHCCCIISVRNCNHRQIFYSFMFQILYQQVYFPQSLVLTLHSPSSYFLDAGDSKSKGCKHHSDVLFARFLAKQQTCALNWVHRALGNQWKWRNKGLQEWEGEEGFRERFNASGV